MPCVRDDAPLRKLPFGAAVAYGAEADGQNHQTRLDINGAFFAVYLNQVLGLTLVPGDVVVLDNLPAHKVAGLAELVAARGACLLYRPPYSPDFNPIERAFSKLKTWLRTAQARTRDALEAVIQPATDWVTQADAKNWFDHCGYHVQ